MSQSASASSNPSLLTRALSALAGGGFTYMVASSLTAIPFVAIACALLVAAVGLAAPRWLLLPFALVTVPLYRAGKELSKKAYSGFMRGIFNGMAGLASATTASVYTATWLGWAHNLTFLIWFPATVIAFVATFFILEPAAYLYIIHPICKWLEKVFKRTQEFIKKHAKPFFAGIVEAASKLPGSAKLWAYVKDDKTGARWVKNLAGVISVIVTLGLGWTIATSTYGCVTPLLPLWLGGWFAVAVGVIAAGVAGILVAGLLFQLLGEAELDFIAPALTIAAIYFALPLAGLVGLGLVAKGVISVVAFVLGVAYIYPGLHSLFKTGFIKAILDGVKWMVDSTYDDYVKEEGEKGEQLKAYKKFFANVATIVIALTAGGLAFWGLAFYGIFPIALVAALALVAAAVAYLSVGEGYRDFHSTFWLGAAASVGASYGLSTLLPANISDWGYWTALIANGLAWLLVVVPAIYLALRWATISWLAKPAGEALGAAHKKAYEAARRLTKWYDEKVIDRSINDKTDYRDLFLHVVNIVVLALGVWQAKPLLAGWLGLPTWGLITLVTLLGFATYQILGRILLGERAKEGERRFFGGAGPAGVAGLAGLAVFAHVSWSLYGLNHDYWWLGGLIGACAGLAFTYLAVPVAYVAVKFVADPIFTKWLLPIIDGVFAFFWKRTEWLTDAFMVVARWVNKKVISPIVRLFVALVAAIKDIWDSMFGSKKA